MTASATTQDIDPATARRMAIIAFCSQNISSATVYGSFGVLLAGVEGRYGVSRQGSSLALPLMSAALALSAPIAGVLVERFSARFLMMLGSLFGAAGFAILALSNSHAAYLAVYPMLFGPAICLCTAIAPSTLITRWYPSGRGRALGFVHMPLLMGPVALGCAFLVQGQGLPSVYAGLAALWLINLLLTSFVIDRPLNAIAHRSHVVMNKPAPDTQGEGILSSSQFWFLTFAFAVNVGANVTFGAHLVPMVTAWGIPATLAATVVMAASIAGIVGTPVMGWIMDCLGARLTITLLSIDCAILWAILLFQPPYAALIVIAFLLGFHSAAITAVFAGASSEFFGKAKFARTFGLSKLFTLPVTLSAVPGAALIYVRTGSYTNAVEMQAALLFLAGLAMFFGCRR